MTSTENLCLLTRLPDRAVDVFTNKSKLGLQFFFKKEEKRVRLKRRNLNCLLTPYDGTTEVNSIISYRISKIIDVLLQVNHVEILKAFAEMSFEGKLLNHIYDESVSLTIFYNVLVNIKGRGNDDSLIFDSPKKSRSTSFEILGCNDKLSSDPNQETGFEDNLSLAVCDFKENSPKIKTSDQIFLTFDEEDIIKEYSKKQTNHSLNASTYMETEKIKQKYFHSIWEYRLKVIRRLIDYIHETQDEIAALNGLRILAKLLTEGHELLDFVQVVIVLLYKENYLMKIYNRAKRSSSNDTFSMSIDVLVALLELHIQFFSGKICEDKGIKLGAEFFGKFVDVIEGLKDELSQVF
jgi:hypothetical protein